jgi:hypothetical protein
LKRSALIALAFLGTAVYAGSFAALSTDQRPAWLLPLAIGVAIASGVSWPLLGIVLLRLSPDRATLMRWFDACLVTIAFGEAWLLSAAAWNIIAVQVEPAQGLLLATHLALLLAADITMCAIFARRARAIGMPTRQAITIWVFVMNGVFAALLLALAKPLGYWA